MNDETSITLLKEILIVLKKILSQLEYKASGR